MKTMGSASGVKVIDTVRSTTGRELKKTAKKPMRSAQILPHSTSPTCRGALNPQDILTGGKEVRLWSHGEAIFSLLVRAPVYHALQKVPHLSAHQHLQVNRPPNGAPILPTFQAPVCPHLRLLLSHPQGINKQE